MKSFKFCLYFLIPFLLLSCSDTSRKNSDDNSNNLNDPSENNFSDYSVYKAYDNIKDNQNNSGIILLDVRTPEEYRTSHIKGSLLINFNSPDFEDQLSKLDRNKKYIVYCRVGNRSGKAVKIMENMKFIEAHNVSGGITEWQSNHLSLDFSR